MRLWGFWGLWSPETAQWEMEAAFRESQSLMPRTMRSVILGLAEIFCQRLDMQK